MNRSQHWAAVLAHKLDWPSKISGYLVAWMIIPMILSLTYEVVARYAFQAPTIWAYDMTFMLYGTFFMLGSAYTLQKKGHIRTDMYYGNWSPKKTGFGRHRLLPHILLSTGIDFYRHRMGLFLASIHH